MDIQGIKNGNDIGTVIERYVAILWRGHKGTGICPFHDDRHPSLTVDRQKQFFICYACGAKGDVINFVKLIENCTFREALYKLNTNFAMKNERQTSKNEFTEKPTRKEKEENRTPVDLNQLLPLLMPYPTGNPELSDVYLDFEVGIAPVMLPPQFKSLANRIVFPVRDEQGVLCGFAGRKQSDDGKGAKYMNTTAKDGFKRSEILYGLHKAKKAILNTGYVYVVEGYKDVLAMHAAGYTNTVGLCGTAMTAKQIKLIMNYTMRVHLLLDSDEAGKAAALKIEEALKKKRVECFVFTLPEVSDPDSLFRTADRDNFHKMIESYLHFTRMQERLFVAACLFYQDVEEERDGEIFPLPFLYYYMLKNENLLPVSPLNRKVLKYMIEDIANEEELSYPPEIEKEITFYQEKLFVSLLEVEKIMEKRKEAGNEKDFRRILLTLIYDTYLEERLRNKLQKMSFLINHESNPDKRNRLIASFDDCLHIYEKITEKMGLGGVIRMDWFSHITGSLVV